MEGPFYPSAKPVVAGPPMEGPPHPLVLGSCDEPVVAGPPSSGYDHGPPPVPGCRGGSVVTADGPDSTATAETSSRWLHRVLGSGSELAVAEDAAVGANWPAAAASVAAGSASELPVAPASGAAEGACLEGCGEGSDHVSAEHFPGCGPRPPAMSLAAVRPSLSLARSARWTDEPSTSRLSSSQAAVQGRSHWPRQQAWLLQVEVHWDQCRSRRSSPCLKGLQLSKVRQARVTGPCSGKGA